MSRHHPPRPRTGPRFGLAMGAAAVALALTVADGAEAAPKSLFVQATSVPKGADAYQTRTWFKKLCDAHRTSGANDYIHNLVLSEIADQQGNLDSERLDIVEDYFGCFDNIFIGTALLSHPDPYVSGMKDATFRWDNIYLSESVGQAYDARFSQRFPNATFHWYLSYEANVNAFVVDVALKGAYIAFLLELSNRLTTIRDGSVLWSPAFWTQFNAIVNQSALVSALSDVLTAVPKLNWLHFQDFVGQAALYNCNTSGFTYGFNASDGIGYFGLVSQAAAGSLASLKVNMEHFALGGSGCSNGSIYPGEASEIATRESAYQGANVPIGASWEIRWWYQALYGPTGTACDAPEVCDGVDNDCDLLVDEDAGCGGNGGGGSAAAGGAGGQAVGPGGAGGDAAGGAASGGAASGGSNRPRGASDSDGGCTATRSRSPSPTPMLAVLMFAALALARLLRRRAA